MSRHALVVGIGQNLSPLHSLSKAVGDAEAIAKVLETNGDYRVQRLIGNVTQQQLLDALKLFLERVKDGGQGFLYYTGHGLPVLNDVGKPKPWFVPSNCVVVVRDGKAIEQREGLSFLSFSDLVKEAKAGELVILLDCCHSGYFLDRALIEETLKAFNSKNYFLIAACQSYESGFARPGEAHSVFTGAVLEGLAEERVNDRGVVTGDMLFAHVAERLRQPNQQLPDGGQQPVRLGIGDTIDLVNYGRQALATVICEKNPYQGLAAFTKDTRQFFFGRDSVVDDLLLKLQGSSFVPLFGASGSGKSSVVRAGLEPRLEEMGWQVLGPMKPGPEPIVELKRSFDTVFERKQLGTIYQQIETEGLKGIVAQLPAKRYLLVIDQFEEVFTLCEDRAKQRQFIELLMGLEVGDRLSIVTTMRSDFVEAWQAHGDLVSVLQRDTVWMPPLEGNDLRDAIVKPAEAQGYGYERELEALILEDVMAEPNSLPLLEFALSGLWERRNQERHMLTVQEYRQMGKLMGALDQHATKWYEGLTSSQQSTVQQVMLDLVRVGVEIKDMRWRRRTSDIMQQGDGVEEVIELLLAQRLIVREEDAIDLAHERLMDGWSLFAEWRKGDRDLRRLAQQIKDLYKEWLDKEQSDEYLIQGGFLLNTINQLDDVSEYLSDELRCFCSRSIEANKLRSQKVERSRCVGMLNEKVRYISTILEIDPAKAIVESIVSAGDSIKNLGEMLNPVEKMLCKISGIHREISIVNDTKTANKIIKVADDKLFIFNRPSYSYADEIEIRMVEISTNLSSARSRVVELQTSNVGLSIPLGGMYLNAVCKNGTNTFLALDIVDNGGRSDDRHWLFVADLTSNEISLVYDDYSTEAKDSIGFHFRPGAPILAYLSVSKKICFFDYHSKSDLCSFKAHNIKTFNFTFFNTKDGRFATLGVDKMDGKNFATLILKVWALPDKQIYRWDDDDDCDDDVSPTLISSCVIEDRVSWEYSVLNSLFSPNLEWLLIDDGSRMSLRRRTQNEYHWVDTDKSYFSNHSRYKFSSDNKYLIVFIRGSHIEIVDLQELEKTKATIPDADNILDADSTLEENTIILVVKNKGVVFWDIQEKKITNWEDALSVSCNRLRHHPALNDPNNPTAVEACEVCRKYVWEAEGN
jgi:Caspase domain